VQQRLHAQADLAALVGLEDLHAHDLAFLHIVGDVIHALVGDLRHVQQAVTARHDVHDGAEVEQTHDRAFVDLADFDFGGDRLDLRLRQLRALGAHRRDLDRAVVLDLDHGAGLFLQRADHRTALADHVADLLGVDLHVDHARRVFRHLAAAAAERLLHDAEDVQAAFLGLLERGVHDLFGDALDLDVHLQAGDAVFGTGHLEVHVAEVVLVAQDIGQHCEAVAVLDQAHGDAGAVVLQRHAGIHHGERTTAHRGHRRRAVGFGDLGDHAHGVGELFRLGQHGDQRALGQAAVADFAALGDAEAAGLAGAERREVVVQQEALAVFAGDRVNDLLVAAGAERGHDQGLRLATGEQRRTVGARQHAGADLDRTHGARVATVDARLAVEDAAADDTRLEVEEDVLELVDRRCVVHAFGELTDHALAD